MKTTQLFTFIIGTAIVLASCKKEGCTDQSAANYDPNAENDDGSCVYDGTGGGNDGGGDGSGNTDELQNLAGNSGSPVTISDVYSDNSVYDYYIDGTWEINAAATIEPGVRILMKSGAQVEVNENGSLTAIGTGANKIAFIGEQAVPGYWDVIRFDRTNNPNNELTYVEVKHAGGEDYYKENAAVFVEGKARLKMNNTRIENSERRGLKVRSIDGILTEFSNNTITDCGSHSIYLHNLGQLENFAGNNNLTTGNTYNVIQVDGGKVNDPVDIPFVNSKILIEDEAEINADVTIAAGNYFEMGSAASIEINSNGSLAMNGTASDRITITGAQEVKGYWECIRFDDSNNPSNEMQYVDISYGGGDDYYLRDAMIFVRSSGYLQMGNSSVTFSERDGVKVKSTDGTFINDGNNTFSNNDGQDVNLP